MLSRLAVAVALIGCSAAPPPVSHPRVVTATGPHAQLALGEIKLDLGHDRVLRVHADGSVEAEGRTALFITEDGRVTAAGLGTPVLALQRDGSIRDRDGALIERLHLDTNGMLTNAGRQITIDANGLFTGIRAPGASVVGATDAPLRRTALLVLVAATVGGSHSAPDDLATNAIALPVVQCSFGT